MAVSVAIGIDLGTTNTVVAAVVDGTAVTLEDEKKRRLLPSIVSFHPSGTVLVGDAARERRFLDPLNTVYSIKTLIGRPFDSPEVKVAIPRFPFPIIEGSKNSVTVQARGTVYALPEISAFVLRRAKAIAEAALGVPVEKAVITVPANFNDLQRASTKIAGKLAGLEVMRILNEPTAAALAYGQSIAQAEKIAVYDLGGGTFDVTMLDLTGNVFEVLATAGDSALGGDDIDRLLADKLSLEVLQKHKYDPRSDPIAFGRLRHVSEDIKKKLSTEPRVTMPVEEIGYAENGAAINASFVVTREDLERIAKPLVDRTIAVAKQSMESVGLTTKDFDRVLLVGGSTRIPLVGRAVEGLFGKPPHRKVNPDEVVALGAAIQAHALSRTKISSRRKTVPGVVAPPANAAPDMFELDNPVPDLPAPRPAAAVPPRAGAPRPAAAAPVPPPPVARDTTPPNTEPEPPTGKMPTLDLPSHFDLSKAPAVISFSAPPPPAPSRTASSPPPLPSPSNLPPPRVPGRASAPDTDASLGAFPPFQALASSPDGPAAPPPDAPQLTAPTPFMPFAPPGTAMAPAHDQPFELAAKDFFPLSPLQTGPQREQAFARGSAIATSEASPLLIDVTPLSLRVETVGGYSDILINANSPVPCEKTRTFLTASDRQVSVVVRVAQGESTRFAENQYLGELELSGLTAAPRGQVKIAVTFELDADGILNVRAKDRDTGQETKTAMRLLGASNDKAEMAAMADRQARHVVA